MRRALAPLCTVILLFVPVSLHALSGIGVSDHTEGGLYVYIVENDEVADSYKLLDGSIKFPVLNTSGTHVAYRLGTSLYLCRIDDAGSNEKLMDLGSCTSKMIEWPHGKWIYYGCNSETEIWRVHSSTREKEHIFTLNNEYNTNAMWCMSGASSNRIIMGTHDDPWVYFCGDIESAAKPIQANISSAVLWNGGHGLPGGCGTAASPGGIFVGSQSGAGHTDYNIFQLDHTKKNFADGNNDDEP
ncbi:MAG: hypothetical protein GF398_16910 [Chitinivibrionales bacterium]|nr:hypothetical protein [Chitinivibrionales bacterium]